MRKKFTCHIALPVLMPVSFFLVASTPVYVLGCRTRGLTALLIALISGISALGTTLAGVKQRSVGDPNFIWWLRSTLILVLPVIALLIMA